MRKIHSILICFSPILLSCPESPRFADASNQPSSVESTAQEKTPPPTIDNPIRFASFNVSFNRKSEGQLISDLRKGSSDQARKIAEVIQRIRPDVILLNEVDYDPRNEAIGLFRDLYLGRAQNGQPPIEYDHVYAAPVNTGVDSCLDLNANGKTGEPDDAFGYGKFPGQYGMVVLSRFPIDRDRVRSFQKFRWRDMPGAKWPTDPETGQSWYSDDVKKIFRLSSKSHWDVPVAIGGQTIHFICAHPTPSVFDGPEDRNGRRNHDEIRMIADYVGGSRGDYLYDDQGNSGGLESGELFVIAGDMNADPLDGESFDNAINQLIEHPRVNSDVVPTSDGGTEAAETSGGANAIHRTDPACDTGDFNDKRVGNLRIDYVLPSRKFRIANSGVFWPAPNQPGNDLCDATDHHLVWIEIVSRTGNGIK